jgi:hypothetical protein
MKSLTGLTKREFVIAQLHSHNFAFSRRPMDTIFNCDGTHFRTRGAGGVSRGRGAGHIGKTRIIGCAKSGVKGLGAA